MAKEQNANVPSSWYKYDFPLKENDKLPTPSNANYDSKNCAWLIEFFAGILNKNYTQLYLHYENNTPKESIDDIYVSHPKDQLYLPEKQTYREGKSSELLRYETLAKNSKRLSLFEENSPAKITYFQSLP